VTKLILSATLISALALPASSPAQNTAQETKEVSASEKKSFLKLLRTLQVKGEFFTEEAVLRAGPRLRVLLALTEKELAGLDIYPFLALSRGMCDHKEYREYGALHFGAIRHPVFKLFWGAVLFDEKAATPEIVEYLQSALKSKDQSKTLSEMPGPNYENFRERVMAYHGKFQ